MELSVPALRIGKDLQWGNPRWTSNENPVQSIMANAGRVRLRILKGTMLITSITERWRTAHTVSDAVYPHSRVSSVHTAGNWGLERELPHAVGHMQ